MSTLAIADCSGSVIRRIDLHTRERLTIGRSTQRDLIINDPGISRFHCMLYLQAGCWCIADAGSRSGTWIDGHLVVWKRLPPGRVANVGHVRIWIEEPEGERNDDACDSTGRPRSTDERNARRKAGGNTAEPPRVEQNATFGATSAFLTAETDFLVPADRIPDPPDNRPIG